MAKKHQLFYVKLVDGNKYSNWEFRVKFLLESEKSPRHKYCRTTCTVILESIWRIHEKWYKAKDIMKRIIINIVQIGNLNKQYVN